MSEAMEIDVERYRARNRKTVRHRRRQASKPRCEVIAWGKKGPHQCEHRAQRTIDGHGVCSMHYGQGRRAVVFTVEDAREYRRQHPHRVKLEIGSGQEVAS